MTVSPRRSRQNLGDGRATEFWRLDSPKYNDYVSAFINGDLEHPYRLPDIKCDIGDGGNCGDDMIPPNETPPAWRTKRFMDPKPVSPKEFNRLVEELQSTGLGEPLWRCFPSMWTGADIGKKYGLEFLPPPNS